MGAPAWVGALTLVLGRNCVAILARVEVTDQVAGRGNRHRPHRRHLRRPHRRCRSGDRLVGVPAGLERHARPSSSGRRSAAASRETCCSASGYLELAVEPARRRAEYVGRLRRHAPHRPTASTEAPPSRDGKGEAARRVAQQQTTARGSARTPSATLAKAAAFTGSSKDRLRTDAVANICGGAAVLAVYQPRPRAAKTLGDWSAAVARYSGADDKASRSAVRETGLPTCCAARRPRPPTR